ncbi:MAG TPA: hypothetical protein PKD79_01715 [Candidatus Doudnabacteria bacterium]|nr:hypothetical protein [Candidatus Doudnabacteria bacterium]
MKSLKYSFSFVKRFHLALLGAGGIFLFSALFPMFSAQAITISPPRLELAGDPGTMINSEFKVTNDGSTATIYYTQVENFEAGDESGNPVFVPTREGLATWVNVAPSINTTPGEQVVIPFSIQIPRNAEPGGYFASIFVRTTPPPTSANEVSIGARLGTLLFVRVNGEMREGVTILEYATKDSQRVFTSLPVEFYYRFQNTGADRVKPEGSIIIKNVVGLTAKNLSANRTEGSVLPRSIRRFESAWITSGGGKEDVNLLPPSETIDGFLAQAKNQFSNFAFGYYTANLDIRFGENNNTATDKYRFFVIPWQLLTLVIASFLILWIIFRTIMRAYTRRIIKLHQKGLK